MRITSLEQKCKDEMAQKSTFKENLAGFRRLYLELEKKFNKYNKLYKQEKATNEANDIKVKNLIGSLSNEQNDSKSGSIGSSYRKLICSKLVKLDEALRCPISLDVLKDPQVLPSGNTISKFVLEKLIKDKKSDPFDRTAKLKSL